LAAGGFAHSDNGAALLLADQGKDQLPVLLVAGVDATSETAIWKHNKVFAFGIATSFGAGRAAGLDSAATRRSRLLHEIDLEPHVILL
jgi:hypothetical protein